MDFGGSFSQTRLVHKPQHNKYQATMRVVVSSCALLWWLSSLALTAAELTEREILTEFYTATGGSSWNRNKGWEDNADDICSWDGVICTGEEADLDSEIDLEHGRRHASESTPKVIGLSLKDNNLSGRTTSSLFELPLLQSLALSYNDNLDVSFLGSENAKKLVALKIHTTGTTSMSGLSGFKDSLEALHMSGTKLEHTAMPAELFLLTNLKYLHMAECQFEGTIPQDVAKLSNLVHFNVFGNQLTGTVPYSFANMQNLQLLTLTGNKFTGTVPALLQQLTKLESLYLDGNLFTGSLPSFSTLGNLQELYLNYNYLTGTIPSDFLATATQPKITIDLAGNRLTGTIPSTLSSLGDQMIKITLTENLFTGLDASLCNNTKWQEGGVRKHGCDALVCPVGTYGSVGRKTNKEVCKDCASGVFVGQTYCLDDDDPRAILEAVYTATDGRNWLNRDNWLSDKDVCEWYGVQCWKTSDEKKGHVQHLLLDANNVVGTIPQSIYALKYLTTLSVSRNAVVLPFDTIGQASWLFKVNVAATDTVLFDGIQNAQDSFAHLIADKLHIGGAIPSELFQLTALETLSMAFSDLSGPISNDIGLMTGLTSLFLYDNNLIGQLPTGFANLVKLKVLSLAKNKITGVIPSAIASMTNLEGLALTDQVSKGGGIAGEVPTFETNTALTTVMLGRNAFEGTIPADLLRGANLDGPLRVDLSNNHLTGTVPGALSRFEHLDLMVENNYISGIDKRLCVMDGWMNGNVRDFGCDAILCPASTTSATGRRVYENQECNQCGEEGALFYGQTMCGEREAVMTEREILQLLFDATNGRTWHSTQNWYTNAHVCEWFGISCDDANSVVSIVLGSNNLQGTVPTAIYQLPELARVSLFSNDIEYSFEGIDLARNLQSLVLDSTGLKSLEGVGLARSLRELNVRFNDLHTIPDEVGRLVYLEALEVSNNKLSGPLPSWLENLPVLETFVAAHNDFDGSLLDFSKSESLIYLDLSSNRLSGPVPPTFLQSSDSKEKIFVNLSDNQLTGTVPGDLDQLDRLSIHLMDNQIQGMDDALCTAGGWNDNDVKSYGCDGILCPAGTYNPVGRQSYDESACEPCKRAKYMGATACSGALRTFASLSIAVSALLSTVYLIL